LLVVIFVVPEVSKEESLSIPDCTNMKVTACQNKLEEAGFVVSEEIEAVPSDDVDKNRVVKTDPEKGRNVKAGTKVTIYKSSGEDTIPLEDYLGKNAIEIKTLLETKYELSVTIKKKEPENTEKEYDDDEVIGQSLPAGTAVKKGDQLILYTPNIVDTFPDMVEEGWSISDVEAFCNKYGLVLEKVEQETSTYAVGTVIGQSRTKGSTIVKGTTLKITVAIKPVPKEQPKEEEKEDDNGEQSGSDTGDNTEGE
jgi:serine/threonine-protein kinase